MRKQSSELEADTETDIPSVVPIVHDVLSSPGQPLDASTRTFMESRFGHDFSQVRVHTDERAAESARTVNALAYTVGQDIVFKEGHYQPSVPAGQPLLAHELAHVVQQGRGGSIPPQLSPQSPLEQAADSTASMFMHSNGHVQVAGASALGLARQIDITEEKPDLVRKMPLKKPPQIKPASTATQIHPIDMMFQAESNRWLVSIDGIPVAEITVANKNTSFTLDVNTTGSTATVRLSHEGDASLAPATTAQATLGLNIQLTEVDLRQPTERSAPPSAPPVSREEAKGTAELVVAPPSVFPWLDEPRRGEVELVQLPLPAQLSDFEEGIRAKEQAISGIILDPDDHSQIIGYNVGTGSVTLLTDREGHIVLGDEGGLETPLLDPLDLLPTPGTAGKVATGIGGRLAVKVGIKAASKKAATGGLKVGLSVLARMRGVAKRLAGRGLRKLLDESPAFVRRITKAGLDHSFERHAVEWFGRTVSKKRTMQYGVRLLGG